MPDFCSGATNRLGCFIEGFSLRRVQSAMLEIDAIPNETIKNPVGPEFMAPSPKLAA